VRNTPFEKLISVAEWMRSIQKVTPLSVAVNACTAIPTASEVERAKTIQATLRYVEKVLAVHARPASDTFYKRAVPRS
jgi:hypothetical protein